MQNCNVRSQQRFSQWRLLKQCNILFLSRTSKFIKDEEFFVLSDLLEWKNAYSPYEIIQLST